MIASFILLVTIVALGAPVALVLIPWALITGNVAPLYSAAISIVRIALRLGRIQVRTEGLELVPANTACIFMANHVSNLDPPALIPLIPGRTSAFLKRSLTRIPVLGYAMKLGEFIPVDRDGSKLAAVESARMARSVIEKGLHITIFVEGTRSLDGRMQPFKKGPFHLATETGAPCIPVSIYGSERLMAKGSLRIRSGIIHIVFHAPIDPRDHATREDLMAAVRGAIASGLPEWMRT
ncbi:MAG TPA: lysophospholipid acyltransferase family protein [Terracidiphilus sp.]|jgi:1-acyl-sn-glycerol-3-phosphate acyltransferase|nr:lysophospholipid acyltransferase family protein [Terracidiphilus sp.]